MEVVDAEAGFGTVGFVAVGFRGFVVGSVVIGVVISFSVVEIERKACSFPTLWCGILFCTSASFSVATDALLLLLVALYFFLQFALLAGSVVSLAESRKGQARPYQK